MNTWSLEQSFLTRIMKYFMYLDTQEGTLPNILMNTRDGRLGLRRLHKSLQFCTDLLLKI